MPAFSPGNPDTWLRWTGGQGQRTPSPMTSASSGTHLAAVVPVKRDAVTGELPVHQTARQRPEKSSQLCQQPTRMLPVPRGCSKHHHTHKPVAGARPTRLLWHVMKECRWLRAPASVTGANRDVYWPRGQSKGSLAPDQCSHSQPDGPQGGPDPGPGTQCKTLLHAPCAGGRRMTLPEVRQGASQYSGSLPCWHIPPHQRPTPTTGLLLTEPQLPPLGRQAPAWTCCHLSAWKPVRNCSGMPRHRGSGSPVSVQVFARALHPR